MTAASVPRETTIPVSRRRASRPVRWLLVLGLALGIVAMHHGSGGDHREHIAAAIVAGPAATAAHGESATASAWHALATSAKGLSGPAAAVLTVPASAGLIGSGPTVPPGPLALCLFVLASVLIVLLVTGRGAGRSPAMLSGPDDCSGASRLRARPGNEVLLDKCVLRT